MTTPTSAAPAPLRRTERAMMFVLAVAAVLAVCWVSAMIYIVAVWAIAL
ncbi:morphogenic membrane protein MmpA [Streptomyces sp.]